MRSVSAYRRFTSTQTTVLVALALASLLPPAAATTYTVRPDGSGDFATIQEAVDATTGGDIIELTDGTFEGAGNRDIDYLGRAITIRSQGGIPENCIIDCFPGPHRGFHFHSGEGPASVLDGVTIAHGYATLAGGGMVIEGSSPTITDCILRENSTAIGAGGIYCSAGAAPTLERCEFRGNSCPHGDGGALVELGGCAVRLDACVFIGNSARMSGAITTCGAAEITRCLFTDNWAEEYGGAVSCSDACSAQIRDCTFIRNSAYFAGAICCFLHDVGGVSPLLQNCTLVANDAPLAGSAISVGPNGPPLLVENCVLAFGTGGRAIACEYVDAPPLLSCCDIYGNAGGDWVGCVAQQLGIRGNISADPLFCDAPSDDYTLADCSPCAPFTPPNPECDLIGAWPVGCGASPTWHGSWGEVKARFRR